MGPGRALPYKSDQKAKLVLKPSYFCANSGWPLPRVDRIVARRRDDATHGTDMTLYNIPILVPTRPLSEMDATAGVSTDMNAPDTKP